MVKTTLVSNKQLAEDKRNMSSIKIFGLLPSTEFQIAKCCAEDLYKSQQKVFKEPIITPMLEFEWSMWLDSKKLELKGEVWAFTDVVMIFADDKLIGDSRSFIRWAIDSHNFEDFRNEALYETLRKEAYAAFIANTRNDFVFMDIVSEGQPLGKLVIELYKNLLPKTSENFRLLCSGEKGRSESTGTKLNYENCLINRIVPNGWIQGGDTLSGKGNGSESVYGGLFEDESFAVKHDKRGVIGMANNGRHSNGSQFYICLQPAPFMDKKYVAFGQLVEGSETLKNIEKLNTTNQRPLKECKIAACGVYKFEF